MERVPRYSSLSYRFQRRALLTRGKERGMGEKGWDGKSISEFLIEDLMSLAGLTSKSLVQFGNDFRDIDGNLIACLIRCGFIKCMGS